MSSAPSSRQDTGGRPAVDVVVPFAGSGAALDRLLEDLGVLELGDGDAIVVVDNGPAGPVPAERRFGDRGRVVSRDAVASSYFARNRGAELGAAEWIVFLDADVEPPADLLERYFERPPSARDGLLAGGVRDELTDTSHRRRPAARYADLRGAMSQSNTMERAAWSYAQTANCAVRRAAFEAVGGFDETIRSGGDADLCFRLERAGWTLDRREAALVVHRNRPTLRAMLRQRARHGSGARWLDARYPGSFPARRSAGALVWSVRQGALAILAALRRDADRAILLGVEVLSHWAFELGRLVPNDAHRRTGRSAR